MRLMNPYILFRPRLRRKLAAIVATAATTPRWYEDFQRLTRGSTFAEQLWVCQAIRDDGDLPLEAGFFLVASLAEVFAVLREDAKLSALPRNLRALTAGRNQATNDVQAAVDEPIESHGLQEHVDLNRERKVLISTLIAAGEHDMAKLLKGNLNEFRRLWHRGREFFFGAPPAPVEDAGEWLDLLAKRISDLTTWENPTEGFEICGDWETDFWKIEAYVKPVIIAGGHAIVPAFQLDIQELMGMFEEIDQVDWDMPYNQRILIEGRYQGHNISLSVIGTRYDE